MITASWESCGAVFRCDEQSINMPLNYAKVWQQKENNLLIIPKSHSNFASSGLAALQNRRIFHAMNAVGEPIAQGSMKNQNHVRGNVLGRLHRNVKEMTMNSTTFSNALLPFAGTDMRSAAEARKPSVFARLVSAMMESRRKQAEREIARMEAMYGFSITGGTNAAKTDRTELPFQG